jgi:4-aminobutyrate--pyruvate transaminase
VRRAERHGLIVRSLGDSIPFRPPLIITEPEIKEMFARFGRALEELTASIRDEGLASVA